jgi:hypothetical protein
MGSVVLLSKYYILKKLEELMCLKFWLFSLENWRLLMEHESPSWLLQA